MRIGLSRVVEKTQLADRPTCASASLILPQFDCISIMFSIFLLTYTYIEARANYHRGSILILASVHSAAFEWLTVGWMLT